MSFTTASKAAGNNTKPALGTFARENLSTPMTPEKPSAEWDLLDHRTPEPVSARREAEMEANCKTPREKRYVKGDRLIYKRTGETVKVMKIHFDDEPPYYTVSFVSDGREKQTTYEHLERGAVEPSPRRPEPEPNPFGGPSPFGGVEKPFGTPTRVASTAPAPVVEVVDENPFAPFGSKPFDPRRKFTVPSAAASSFDPFGSTAPSSGKTSGFFDDKEGAFKGL